MADHQIIHAARANGSVYGLWFGATRPSVDGVVDLLVEGRQPNRHPAIRINSNKLLAMMAQKKWLLTAGAHQSPGDQTTHYTVSIGDHKYHLRLDARGHLFDISGPGLPDLAPWAAPGTDIHAPGRGR